MSYNPNNPNGQNTMANSAPVTIASDQTAVPVSATTLPLPTGAATETTLASIKDTAGIKKITDALPAGTNLLGKVGIDQTTPGTTNLVAANITQLAGTATAVGVGASSAGTARVVQANDAGKTILSKAGTVAISGDNTIINAGTNKLKIKAFSLTTTSTTAVTCIFKSSTTVLWQVILQAPTGVSVGANLVVPAPDFIFSTASATLLNLNLSSAQTIHYSVSYYDEA